MIKWLKKIPLFDWIVLFLLLLSGAFFRFYRIRPLMTYLGDEGRDMLIVMDLLKGVNFPFIGPPTSVGKLFLGPIYYYFIAPFVWIFNWDPVGPAVFIAILGVLSIILTYFVGKNYFNHRVGLISAVLLTFSPLIIEFSRSSWNPNPMPFFSLLLMLAIFNWYKKKKPKFLYLAVICFAIMLQLHYMAILLSPFLLFAIWYLGKDLNRAKKKKIRTYLISGLILFLLLSPLLIFDLKHDFYNLRGFLEIFKGRSNEGFSLIDLISRSRDRLRQVFGLFLGIEERSWLNNLIVLTTLIFSFISFKKASKPAKLIIFSWFMWGFLSLGFYRHSVYPHYLGFIFFMPAIFLALSLDKFYMKHFSKKLLAFFLIFLLCYPMIKLSWKNIVRGTVLNVDLISQVVRLIEEESNGNEFNFALLAENNYDSSYRYFFKLWQIPAVFEQEVTDQLFVVCEGVEECQPEGNPKWEIAVFDSSWEGQIVKAGQWQPDPLLRVYKFVPQHQNQ